MKNKQIVMTKFGGVDVLAIQHSAIPEPKLGEVLVKVAFSGVNPIDVKTRMGLGWAAEKNKDKLPWVQGYDISGRVIKNHQAVYEDDAKFQIGDEVAGFIGFPVQGGGYSQYICIAESELSSLPYSVTLESAAALPLAGQTALQALELAHVKEGERVLILAGAGGVGHLATQLALAKKAHVYATCSEANFSYITELGAHAVAYQPSPISQRLQDIDVLIDLVGGDSALDALACIKANGRVVTVPTVTAERVCEAAKQQGLVAEGMLVTPEPKQLDALLSMVHAGTLNVKIHAIYPMEEVANAHLQIETGHTRGKILLGMT